MLRKFLLVFVGSLFALSGACKVWATPSTTYWTPATGDIQPFGVWHITYDTYVSDESDFPADYGLTVGVLPFEKLQMEAGIDIMEPTDDPLLFNAKIGTPEGKLFENSPAWGLGVWNIGTKSGVTDFDIFQWTLSKSLPANLGRLHVAGYYGLTDTLEETATGGDGDRLGFMVAYDKFIYKDKVMFAADYASGENAIGAGGFGLYYFFTPNISLLSGPVWFNDEDLNGNWKWTVQLDINFKF